MYAISWVVAACVVLGTKGAEGTSYSEIGRCQDIQPFSNFGLQDYDGDWYLQYASVPASEPNEYTCQLSSELQYADRYHMYIHYYGSDYPLHKVFNADEEGNIGKYSANIDKGPSEKFTLHWQVLYADGNKRVTYVCSDHPQASSDKLAMYIWTRKPRITEDEGNPIIQNVHSYKPEAKFEKVEQSRNICA